MGSTKNFTDLIPGSCALMLSSFPERKSTIQMQAENKEEIQDKRPALRVGYLLAGVGIKPCRLGGLSPYRCRFLCHRLCSGAKRACL